MQRPGGLSDREWEALQRNERRVTLVTKVLRAHRMYNRTAPHGSSPGVAQRNVAQEIIEMLDRDGQ